MPRITLGDSSGYLGSLMDELDADILVKRPDYYLFGAARTPLELRALLGGLFGQLRPASK